MVVKWNATTLFFGTQQAPVTILVQGGGDSLAANLRVHKNYEEYHTIPSAQKRDHSNNKKRLSLSGAFTQATGTQEIPYITGC